MMRLNLALAGAVILALSACSEAAVPAPESKQHFEIVTAPIAETMEAEEALTLTLPAEATPDDEPADVAPAPDSVPAIPIKLPEFISAPEAYELSSAGQIRLIDIRTPREWRKTGVPEGAATINMRNRDFVDQVLTEVGGDKSTPIALTCATGGRSSNSARTLRLEGFTNVSDVSEGFFGNRNAGPGWQARSLPIDAYVEEAD